MSEDFDQQDKVWMELALSLADQAEAINEVPVGAVLVLDNQIIGQGFNSPISTSDPTAHAEILALRAAAKFVGNYRLINSTLYVTLEPCLMCAGAMVHSRIKRLVFGALDTRSDGMERCTHVLQRSSLNHRITIHSGLLQEECRDKLLAFFKKKR